MSDSTHQPDAAPGAPPPIERTVLERTAIGTGWVIGWRMATRVLGLLNTLVLIRLLAPTDFGLVALGSTFAIAVDTLSELGVENSLVREPHPTRAMYGTAFTLTLIRGLATAVVISAAAVPVAQFFAEPRLAHVLWAIAVLSMIRAATSIGVVDFRRAMDFRKEFLLQLLPRLFSIAVTIGAALTWRSYWALIAGMAAGQVLRTLFSYWMHPWRPQLTLETWRYLFSFSTWSWAISMAELVRDRMDAFFIGRVLDVGAVGVYGIGEEIAVLPTTELVLPMSRSCFSAFAATRAAGHSITDAFMRPVALAFMLTFPAGFGLSLLADPLVRLAVGERWMAAVPVIEVIAPLGTVGVFGVVSGTLLSAYGLLSGQFWITLVAVAVRLALIIPLVAQFGVVGAAFGAAASSMLEHAILTVGVFRRFGMRWDDLLGRVWRSVVATAAMAAVLVGTGLGWHAAPGSTGDVAWVLFGSAALGASVYAVGLLGLWILCGRPGGAEVDALAMTQRITVGLLARFRRP